MASPLGFPFKISKAANLNIEPAPSPVQVTPHCCDRRAWGACYWVVLAMAKGGSSQPAPGVLAYCPPSQRRVRARSRSRGSENDAKISEVNGDAETRLRPHAYIIKAPIGYAEMETLQWQYPTRSKS